MKLLPLFPGCKLMDLLLEYYRTLHERPFFEVDEMVLASLDGQQPVPHGVQTCPQGKAVYENQENHCHFDFALGDSVWERWQNNLILASSVREFWLLKLSKQFPDHKFIIFIYNELAVEEFLSTGKRESEKASVQIVPALRMWSEKNDPHGDMYTSFRVADAKLDAIEIRVNYSPTFVSQDEVFTKQKQVRKSFLRRIAEEEDVGSRIHLTL